jgi:hypothetical protein
MIKPAFTTLIKSDGHPFCNHGPISCRPSAKLTVGCLVLLSIVSLIGQSYGDQTFDHGRSIIGSPAVI